jgi:hypothetical protein
MPHRRILASVVLVASLVAGCQAMQRARPVAIAVQDAETKQPLPDAEVVLSYHIAQPMFAPPVLRGTTGSDGVVRLPVTPLETSVVMMEVTAPGHVPQRKELPVTIVEAVEPAGLFEKIEKRPTSLIAEVYAEPRPSVDLVVPTGYRGLLKIDIQSQKDVPLALGQRVFSYEVPASGELHAAGPTLVGQVYPQGYTARFADGSPLTHEAKGKEIGFWWLKNEGKVQHFLVGTREEFDHARRALDRDDAAAHKYGASGGGGGKGKRGRRGGMQ